MFLPRLSWDAWDADFSTYQRGVSGILENSWIGNANSSSILLCTVLSSFHPEKKRKQRERNVGCCQVEQLRTNGYAARPWGQVVLLLSLLRRKRFWAFHVFLSPSEDGKQFAALQPARLKSKGYHGALERETQRYHKMERRKWIAETQKQLAVLGRPVHVFSLFRSANVRSAYFWQGFFMERQGWSGKSWQKHFPGSNVLPDFKGTSCARFKNTAIILA